MKKLTTTLLFLPLFSFVINAQVLVSESFEGATFPPTGWDTLKVGDGNTWAQKAATSSSGTKCAYYEYSIMNNANAWLFTPSVTLASGENVKVSFDQAVAGSTFPEKLKVTVGTAKTAVAQATVLYSDTNLVNTVFKRRTVVFTATAGGTYYFAFNCFSNKDQYNLYVDSVVVEKVAACSGTPTAGNTVASDSSVCGGQMISLTLSGSSAITGGLTYQWQSSPDNSVWTNIVGATADNYQVSPTALTYYRNVVSCGVTNSANSQSVMVTVNPANLCYCTTNLHSVACASFIDSVSILGTTLANNNTNCGNTTTSYSTFPASGATTATLNQNATYILKVTTNDDNIESMWIDYNQDGTFAASEWTQITTSSKIDTASMVSFTVPLTATLGQTRMRIRTRYSGNSNGAADACSSFGSGETEDYTINIGLVGIDENEISNSLTIYPNPTQSLLNIGFNISNAKNVVVKLINVNGQVVFIENSNTSTTYSKALDLSGFSNGIYYLQIASEKQFTTRKVVLTK